MALSLGRDRKMILVLLVVPVVTVTTNIEIFCFNIGTKVMALFIIPVTQ